MSVLSPNTGKYGREITLYLDSFQAVNSLKTANNQQVTLLILENLVAYFTLFEVDHQSLKSQKQSFADVLQNSIVKSFANFTEKHMCWSLFFRSATSSKRESDTDNFY